MDRGVVDSDEFLVEQRPQKACPDVVHWHAAAEYVERGHDDRLFRQFRIPPVFPEKRDAHPARDDLTMTHRISERGRRMVVSHDEDLRLHDFFVRPRMPMAETSIVQTEPVRGL